MFGKLTGGDDVANKATSRTLRAPSRRSVVVDVVVTRSKSVRHLYMSHSESPCILESKF